MVDETPMAATPTPEPAPSPMSAPAPAPVVPAGEMGLSGAETAIIILLSIFSSIFVPLTLWLVWHDDKPKKASQTLKILLIILVVDIVLFCIIAFSFASLTAAVSNSIGDSLGTLNY